MKKKFLLPLLIILCSTIILGTNQLSAQHSIARQWNEKVLDAIRGDFARPTVHARNLFHTSIAMYDAWAVYDGGAETYLLGKNIENYACPYTPIATPVNIDAAQREAISFAVYRIIQQRFVNAPDATAIFEDINLFMEELGYDVTNSSTDYVRGAAEMGNYIAANIIEFGLQDGSNEQNDYANQVYLPVNPPMNIVIPGNVNILNLNRWQPLRFTNFIDQGGNDLGNAVPDFLSPEWGQVTPFSLQTTDLSIFPRGGFDYLVYHDPGPPAYLDTINAVGIEDPYKWGNALVSAWSSHLDPADGVMWDISPGSIGNIQSYPTDVNDYPDFYRLEEGGDASIGHTLNPKTNAPYEPQFVPRADYARVLAEFWADGPDSETPPGHWFTILNYVNDQAELEKRMGGSGEILSDLEWDIKSYFILGGTMHDVAISAWGIKGWYDYVRPVSAIRGMAELGQSSNPDLPNYHPGGLPLIPDYIELIQEGDPLAGFAEQYINHIKIKAWKGPGAITNPETDIAEVDWIRAALWYPYQRPTFVTPPFAGYISGHSTYSRAAAEVLTSLTGDPFFPGGMGEFTCPKDNFLVFEKGPSVGLTLQWATYRDASDQCSLSRIWGGIHPPVDDIPGRLIGIAIGQEAFEFATSYFSKNAITPIESIVPIAFPNPTNCGIQINYSFEGSLQLHIYNSLGQLVQTQESDFSSSRVAVNLDKLSSGVYYIIGKTASSGEKHFQEKVVKM